MCLLWKLGTLEYAVKFANYIKLVRLSGTVEKEAKRIFVVNCAIPMMIA